MGGGIASLPLEDGLHKSRICELHDKAKGHYGHRPIYEYLEGEGIACGRGSTYSIYEYQRLLEFNAIGQSMSAKGNCCDNAAMESFYGRYKTYSVCEHVFENETHARANAFECIEIFYNRFRKHASLGYKSPIQGEEKSHPRGGMGLGIPSWLTNN